MFNHFIVRLNSVQKTEFNEVCCTFRTVLVYRLGGTTLDVTVLAVSGGMYRVVATEHDTTLGGLKFDELLSQHLAAEFQRFLHISELSISNLSLKELAQFKTILCLNLTEQTFCSFFAGNGNKMSRAMPEQWLN